MLKRKSGRIINLASVASFLPGPYMAVYYATKHYVLNFSESLAEELTGSGVTVTALCPGPTQSKFQTAASMESSKLVKGRKLPTSQEVAEYGYKAAMNGKRVAIHGWRNRVLSLVVRLVPRTLMARLVNKVSGQ
jgi:short-subunit dehydrogenase